MGALLLAEFWALAFGISALDETAIS